MNPSNPYVKSTFLIAAGILFVFGCSLFAQMDTLSAPKDAPQGDFIKSQIKELSGKILIDAQVEVTQPLQVDKWIDLVEISTPTTPSAGHARIFLTPGTGSSQQLSVIFDDGTAVKIANN